MVPKINLFVHETMLSLSPKPVFIADNGFFFRCGGRVAVCSTPHTSAQTKALIETAISHLVLLLSCLLGIHASLSDDKVVPVRGGTRRVSQPSRFKEWEDWAGVSTVRRSVTSSGILAGRARPRLTGEGRAIIPWWDQRLARPDRGHRRGNEATNEPAIEHH